MKQEEACYCFHHATREARNWQLLPKWHYCMHARLKFWCICVFSSTPVIFDEQGLCPQVAHFMELAKAAWATRDSEEAVALEMSADAAQKEAIIIARTAESSWQEAQDTEAEANRLASSVQVRPALCLRSSSFLLLLPIPCPRMIECVADTGWAVPQAANAA